MQDLEENSFFFSNKANKKSRRFFGFYAYIGNMVRPFNRNDSDSVHVPTRWL